MPHTIARSLYMMALMILGTQLDVQPHGEPRSGTKVAPFMPDASMSVELLEKEVGLDHRELQSWSQGYNSQCPEYGQRVGDQDVCSGHLQRR